MKKNILITSLIIIFSMIFIIVRHINQPISAATHTIGILQTASHPALDACRDGFIEELKNKMGDDIEFTIKNAQGSVAQAHTIAQQFHLNKQCNAFFVIATPAAQAMSAVEKKKPIIISAVTDPHALGFIHPMTNVCGVTDMVDVKAEIKMLTQLVPQAKKVSLLYTSGETNSIALVKQMHQELKAHNLIPIDFAVSNEADMHAMVDLACRKTDVILTPTDNTVAATIPVITAITLKYKKPLIVSDNMLVKFGALAAQGINYKDSGKCAARIAYNVLVENKKPYNLPIEQPKNDEIFINEATLNKLGLTVPKILQKHVILVKDVS